MNLIFLKRVRHGFALLISIAAMISVADEAAARSPISLDVLLREGYGSVDLIKGGANRLYIPTEINGKKTDLLLDTGCATDGIIVAMSAGDLHIVPEKGTHVALTANGVRIQLAHGTAQSVRMGNVQIQGTPISFGRISGAGVVGHGFLKRNSAIIDSTNQRLYLRPPGKGHRVDLSSALTAMGLAKAPFVDAPDKHFVLNVEVNGHPAQMALDTGAQMTVLDVRFAKVASAQGWGRRNVYQRDAAGVLSRADLAGTKTFRIGEIPIRTPEVFVSRFAGYDLSHGKVVGVLGLDVIGLNWGIIDVAQQKFYFTKAN